MKEQNLKKNEEKQIWLVTFHTLCYQKTFNTGEKNLIIYFKPYSFKLVNNFEE